MQEASSMGNWLTVLLAGCCTFHIYVPTNLGAALLVALSYPGYQGPDLLYLGISHSPFSIKGSTGPHQHWGLHTSKAQMPNVKWRPRKTSSCKMAFDQTGLAGGRSLCIIPLPQWNSLDKRNGMIPRNLVILMTQWLTEKFLWDVITSENVYFNPRKLDSKYQMAQKCLVLKMRIEPMH